MSKHSARKDFGVFFWLHVFAIAVIYSLPFWLSWEIIILLLIFYCLQYPVFGGCILTILEFKDKNKNPGQGKITSFNGYYLARLGVNINHRKLEFVLNVIIPALLILTAIVWQVLLKKEVLFRIF